MKGRATFPKIKGTLLFGESLSEHTTFRIGGPCLAWVKPRDEEDLRKIVIFSHLEKIKLLAIGAGSNILVHDSGFDGIVVHLGSADFNKVNFTQTRLTAGAGVGLGRLIDLACKKGLGGLEGLTGIPGTLGGAIYMNSSYKGSISDRLRTIKVMDKKSSAIRMLKKKDLKFGNRLSNLNNYIILEATFALTRSSKEKLLARKRAFLKNKWERQPLKERSAGCIFKNPDSKISAAQYIEMANLKGKRVGDAKISEKHANFIINVKKAKACDVARLINLTKKRIKSNFSIDLIPEVTIL